MLLLAGIIAGALYNPWTGPQTREKLMDMIAGSDDLQPLETFDAPASDAAAKVESAVGKGADAASDTAKAAATRSTRRRRRPSRGPRRPPTRSRARASVLERGSRLASARCSAPGTRPLCARDVARVEQHRAGAGRRDRRARRAARPSAPRYYVRPASKEMSSARRQAMRNG